MFVGRKRELELLDQQYHRDSSGFVPIYGRRRVGKSELILQFVAGRPSVYYVGKQAPAALQIAEFLQESACSLDEPLLASYAADGWKSALRAVVSRAPKGRKLVVALDEFQWIAERSPELPSVLQELWDREWQASRSVLLILCGSVVGFMEREVLGNKSPLFGRRTAQVYVKPFSYVESAKFHRRWSLEHRAMAYFVCGGIPTYLKSFDEHLSPEANIRANLLDEFAPLFCEPDFLLREELRDVASYHAVLLALAAGKSTPKEIAAHTSLPERSLHYYLQQLGELGYVGKRIPLDGGRPSPRKVRFRVEDPLLSFWFRFVFPNRTFIGQAGAHQAFRERVKPGLPSYFGTCFERMCQQALPGIYRSEGVSSASSIGEYWNKQVQIDVVGVREDGCIDLGECKWGSVGSAGAVERELEHKVSQFPNPGGATLVRRIFARARPRVATTARWYGLAEIYEAGE